MFKQFSSNVDFIVQAKQTDFNIVLEMLLIQPLQIQLPLYEELVTRSSKLQTQLTSLLTVFNSFLETAEKISYQAVESKSDPELGVCLERIVSRHRNLELIMKTLTRSVWGGLVRVLVTSFSHLFIHPINVQNCVKWFYACKQAGGI